MSEYCRKNTIMPERFIDLLDRHDFFVLTTHDPADADGIGAQMVLACILSERGKRFKIINASPVPEQFRFMDSLARIECWDEGKHRALAEQGALVILDTADEHTLGKMTEVCGQSREVFVIDHHEPKPQAAFFGIYDSAAASTCELAVEIAEAAGATLDAETAFAAYTGMAYDTGFFAYPKTGPKTFRTAISLLERGANPSTAFELLCQNTSTRTLFLQKKAIGSMVIYLGGKVAVQVLRNEDFSETGTTLEDTDGIVNFPLKSRDIAVSLLLKESPDKKVRCSLRSKGLTNVAKIAQEFGGGGHLNAAGFKSKLDVDQTLEKTIASIAGLLEGQQ